MTRPAEHFSKLAKIRAFEEKLLELFSKGKLNGTTHTCIGQESIAVVVMAALDLSRDCVFSNHRGHGHFLCYGGAPDSLLAELMGKEGAVCGGLGGSQHLHYQNYYSNGVQGSIAPVAVGMALAERYKSSGAIVCCFLGDGTLGEGVVYESLNFASLKHLPVLFVVENNRYAQSTPTSTTIAGSITARAEAFGIPFNQQRIDDMDIAGQHLKSVVSSLRESGGPFFQVYDTYRLAAHSKGDDDRPPDEIAKNRRLDPYETLRSSIGNAAAEIELDARAEIDELVDRVESRPVIHGFSHAAEKYENPSASASIHRSILAGASDVGKRQVKRLNECLNTLMEQDDRVVLLGEDLIDPYGGAFKVSKGLSKKYPGRVLNTPISEALIAGLSNGLALRGLVPIAEIMFGDFVGLCFDQILNGASKFPFMYAGDVKVPLVIRTPMGGCRGYGPTHSQSLEKHFVGIPGISIVSLNIRHDPLELLQRAIHKDESPTLWLEWKTDYGRELMPAPPPGYAVSESDVNDVYPTVRLSPTDGKPALTIVSHGGMLSKVENALTTLQMKHEIQVDCIVLTELSRSFPSSISDSVRKTRTLLTVEEGTKSGGIGDSIICRTAESLSRHTCKYFGLAAKDLPIPSSRALESQVLVSSDDIYNVVLELVSGKRT